MHGQIPKHSPRKHPEPNYGQPPTVPKESLPEPAKVERSNEGQGYVFEERVLNMPKLSPRRNAQEQMQPDVDFKPEVEHSPRRLPIFMDDDADTHGRDAEKHKDQGEHEYEKGDRRGRVHDRQRSPREYDRDRKDGRDVDYERRRPNLDQDHRGRVDDYERDQTNLDRDGRGRDDDHERRQPHLDRDRRGRDDDYERGRDKRRRPNLDKDDRGRDDRRDRDHHSLEREKYQWYSQRKLSPPLDMRRSRSLSPPAERRRSREDALDEQRKISVDLQKVKNLDSCCCRNNRLHS